MTGREGETFPGFFYGRRGQPDAGVREVRSSQEDDQMVTLVSLIVWRDASTISGGSMTS